MSGQDHPGVLAPPPLIMLGVFALACALDFGLIRVSSGMPAPLRASLATVLGVGAAALLAAALGRFRSARTNPEPWKPATALVASGVYRYTRNPMYLGMAAAYVALALAFDSGIALLLLVPAVLVLRYGVIEREERYLEAKFGADYQVYRAKVRRWL